MKDEETRGRSEVRPATVALWEKLRDVISNERAWAIIEAAFDAEERRQDDEA